MNTENLTPRERDIARLMVNDFNAREIADELFLAHSTVRSYIRDLYSKLNVHGFDEAVEKIEALGFLDDAQPTIVERKHNLPASPNTLIGREAELDVLWQMLSQPSTRLLTLLGPGGIGKTRLALELGIRHWHEFEHGAYFVALQPLRSDTDILHAIVEAIADAEYGRRGFTRRPKTLSG